MKYTTTVYYMFLIIFILNFNFCIIDSPFIPDIHEKLSIDKSNNDDNCPLSNPISQSSINNEALQIIRREGYTAGYSFKYKIAFWVCEEITNEELVGFAKRANRFLVDPTVPRCIGPIYQIIRTLGMIEVISPHRIIIKIIKD